MDDKTNPDDALKYKLVMVGRKVAADESDKDRYLADIIDEDSQHAIS